MAKSFRIVKIYNQRTTWFCWLFALALLCGCEGYRTAEGTVVDAENGTPLAGVECYVKTAEYTYYTDSTGTFDLGNGMSGCVPECPAILVWFAKEGYTPLLKVNEDANGIIQMHRQ